MDTDYFRTIESMRDGEFARLKDTVYLDNGGAALYSEKQIEQYCCQLKTNLFGNPHSQNTPSLKASRDLEAVRREVLQYFNADPNDYTCIFTSGATASAKLVGELFAWSKHSRFIFTQSNHNSILGIREYAVQHNAQCSVHGLDDMGKELEAIQYQDCLECPMYALQLTMLTV